MAGIHVLVVEDSLTVRKRLCEVLAMSPDVGVVTEAADGQQAVELCQLLRPDVVTMDIVLPIMSGVEATEQIMAHCPAPILIVSSSTNRGEVFSTYQALAAGAVDVLEKPHGTESNADWEERFVSSVKLISRIRVITHPRARLHGLYRQLAPTDEAIHARLDTPAYEVLAVGASTGGPGALRELVKSLPASFPLPVLIVLHIGDVFGPSFPTWLASQTGKRVAFARDGESISAAAGRVLVAPPSLHLSVKNRKARLTSGPERHSCRPSVDVLFESVASEYGPTSAACLLTGMGRDGAAGLLDIHKAGGFTVAQNEDTCVVYGMPREAALLGAAQRILPLDDIASVIGALPAMNNWKRP